MSRDLEVSSTAFQNGEMMPAKFTADGSDISPPLTIENISPEGESIAVIMDDPDAPVGTFTHWMIWNIPVEKNNIPEGIPQSKQVDSLADAVQGYNDFGDVGYRGPAPPSGVHNYHFKIYILDQKIDIPFDSSKQKIVNTLKAHLLQKTEIVTKYQR
jgi:hypothetical protein